MNKKEDREILVFKKFLSLRGLPHSDSLISSRCPPEPDILYSHQEELIGCTAFELVESIDSCKIYSEKDDIPPRDSSIAEVVNGQLENESKKLAWIRAQNTSVEMIRKKLSKKYETKYPIELILYTNGLAILPDDVVLEQLKFEINQLDIINFTKIWFMGDQTVDLVYSSEDH